MIRNITELERFYFQNIFIVFEIPFRNFDPDLIEYVNKFNVQPILFRLHIRQGLLVLESRPCSISKPISTRDLKRTLISHFPIRAAFPILDLEANIPRSRGFLNLLKCGLTETIASIVLGLSLIRTDIFVSLLIFISPEFNYSKLQNPPLDNATPRKAIIMASNRLSIPVHHANDLNLFPEKCMFKVPVKNRIIMASHP